MESMMEQVFISIVTDITFLASSTDWDSEVASLITQLFCASIDERWDETKIFNLDTQILSRKPKMEFASLAHQISFFTFSREVNLDSQPKPESELISLIKQIISLFNSKPDSESELVSLITQTTRLEPTQESELLSLISRLVSLKPEPELTSLITQIISRFKSMNWEPLQLISLCPPLHGPLEDEGECNISKAIFWRGTRKTYMYCRYCNGENHEGYEKAPLEIKHSLHPKHSLQLVLEKRVEHNTRCYCCEGYSEMYYECGVCDFALDIACVDKPLPLATHHAKWHAHPLALFPSQASFPCNICALTHSRCPCDFVVHHNCLSLPRVIRISRHPHRICFTPSLDKGSVCRKKMDNDYGAYSCIGKGCLYVAHVKCATQRNVWDGQDLEGVPEEFEEELEPYVKISHGIIQHFSHQQHHLRLDENKDRDYDENKLCQACTTPIYFGNFYSCLECEFILHENVLIFVLKYTTRYIHTLSLW